jgi:alpha-tubulin suppressor-like RCC1 family protein
MANFYSWTQISNGDQSSAALRSDGSLWSWGNNVNGQLGINDTIYRSNPVQVPPSYTIYTSPLLASSSGAGSTPGPTSIIKADSTLWVWGYNVGQQGLAPLTFFSWTVGSAGVLHTLAIRSDGLLFAWGSNAYGQLGDGTTVNRSSPVQIGSSSWTAVAAGYVHTAAIRLDGALFTWGWNANGNLGNGTTVHRSSPVQLPAMIVMIHRSSPIQIGTGSWSQITAGNQFIYGLTNNNILYGWGLNSSGQIGWNNTITRSSPTQLSSN